MGQLHLSKACWELWLSDDQPHSDYNGQWQRALCILAVLQSSQPNPQRNKKRKMSAIKQIKICPEYRDMLPRPRLDLSGTPGLRLFGLLHTYMHTCMHTYIHTYIQTYLLLLISMLWHGQAIFESKGDKSSSSAECRIRTQRVSETQSSADWMPADKPTELSRIKLKTWTRQPVPMISKHSAHLTSLPFGIRTWLWRYTYLLLLISMLWHR